MEAAPSQKVIEKYGWLTKEEPLSTITDDNLDLQINILESNAPFFGYYADQLREDKPEYLYWVLDQYYSQEQIFRVLQTIRASCYTHLDAAPGTIAVGNEHLRVIRMHNLKRYNQIHAVQEMFEQLGIRLKKNGRRIKNQMGIISLNKFFRFVPTDAGLYLEEANLHRAYFTIPTYVTWEDFKAITLEVKYDTNLLFFDAARAAFMENGMINELVRVYRENLTLDQLKAIRDRYNKVMMQRYS
ncbi:MAG: hypothetical protein ACOC12_00830 [Bacteroidota bacterium]